MFTIVYGILKLKKLIIVQTLKSTSMYFEIKSVVIYKLLVITLNQSFNKIPWYLLVQILNVKNNYLYKV